MIKSVIKRNYNLLHKKFFINNLQSQKKYEKIKLFQYIIKLLINSFSIKLQ